MRLSHKLFLVFGVLIVTIVIALAVPAIGATSDSRQDGLASDGDLCVEIDPEPASSSDLSAYPMEEKSVSDGDLQFDPDYDPSLAGIYNKDWEDSYRGSWDYALYYAYGFSDKYGNFRYAAPGFDEQESHDIANGYIKYKEHPGPLEYIAQLPLDVIWQACADYYPVLNFDEFLQGYIDSDAEDIPSYLDILLNWLSYEPEPAGE